MLEPTSTHAVPGLTVLIVEDNPALQKAIELIVRNALPSAEIQVAGSIQQAIALADAQTPDLVTLDVDLSGEDGLDLLPQFAPRAPVVVLTGQADAVTRKRAQAGGASAFVDKVEMFAQLRPLLLKWFGTSRSSGGASSDGNP